MRSLILARAEQSVRDLAARHDLEREFCDVRAGRPEDVIATIERLRDRGVAVVPHGVKLSLGGAEPVTPNQAIAEFEFTLTFARIDHEVSEGDIPGIVVSRVNMSAKFAKELLDAMTDSWSKYATVRGIQNLPEAPPRNS